MTYKRTGNKLLGNVYSFNIDWLDAEYNHYPYPEYIPNTYNRYITGIHISNLLGEYPKLIPLLLGHNVFRNTFKNNVRYKYIVIIRLFFFIDLSYHYHYHVSIYHSQHHLQRYDMWRTKHFEVFKLCKQFIFSYYMCARVRENRLLRFRKTSHSNFVAYSLLLERRSRL